ncbi:MAG TPA: efflux RND transporter periplasmic adaptor subunit [Polyangia bacterium]|nr:efflux RND transporter periplasmic adaptor subunit [Polyangia bacterium]
MTADVEESERSQEPTGKRGRAGGHRRELITIGGLTALLVVSGGLLVHHAEGKVNRVPLSGAARPVSVVGAQAAPYSDSRSYVGAIDSWIEASVGPQYISAYVTTVLVRPGDPVTHGQVVATLDCAHPNAVSRSVQLQAQAIGQQQRATADEAAREASMLKGGFIAPNQVEQTSAQSSAEQSHVLETKARSLAASLEVHDCALKAPFDGEVAVRSVDPGAFVHPGATIVSVVDRNTVRIVVDAPEKDFNVATVGAPVRVDVLATGATLFAAVTRRAPKADPATRTIHFEVDVADPHREIPTSTTAMVHMNVGKPVPATRIPLDAATQEEGKAKIFVVENDVAHLRQLTLLGERGDGLYFDPRILPANTQIVTEGRALLSDGDAVAPHVEAVRTPAENDGGTRGGGFGRPL